MCRFVAYTGAPIAIADLVTRPAHSIIHQSFRAREREEPLNGDGFGVGWYAPDMSEEPAVFRDVSPAWNNLNLLELARVTRSGTIFAHVRAATAGLGVMQANCHPFAHGRFLWMHNGNVEGFGRQRRRWLGRLSDAAFASLRGTTDSEFAFALWRDRHADLGDELPPLQRMATAMDQTLAELRAEVGGGGSGGPSTMNFVVTDGERVVASRAILGDHRLANTLYTYGGTRHSSDRPAPSPAPGGLPQLGSSVLVASEPLFDHDSWEPVGLNQLSLIEAGRIETREIRW